MANKMTKKDYFNTLLTYSEVQANPAMVEFVEHELELLSRKSGAERKPTAKQMENAGIAEAIVAHLHANPDRLFSITEIIKEVPECADLTNQRVSAIIRGLLDVSITRVEDKRKAFFKALR